MTDFPIDNRDMRKLRVASSDLDDVYCELEELGCHYDNRGVAEPCDLPPNLERAIDRLMESIYEFQTCVEDLQAQQQEYDELIEDALNDVLLGEIH